MSKSFFAGLAIAGTCVTGLGVAYEREGAAPPCNSETAQHALTKVLKDQFHFESIALNNAHALAGGYFARRYACSVEIAELRGGVYASAMHWIRVGYTVEAVSNPGEAMVTAHLEGDAPLDPKRTTWQRLSAHFLP